MEYNELSRLLASEDKDTVREAAFVAGEARCVMAVPLLAGLLRSGNKGIHEAAESALRKIGGPETVSELVPLLRSEDVPLRNVAMEILRGIPGMDLGPIIELLKDPDPDQRIFAADILGRSGVAAAVAPLCHALLHDPESNVRCQAAVSLGEVGDKSAAGCLSKALCDEEWVQFAAIEALTKIGDESCLGMLIGALSSSSDLVASMIVDGLGTMGNMKAAPLLLGTMDGVAPALRVRMALAVVRLLGAKGLALLGATERESLGRSLAEAVDDEDPEIQTAAVRGLSHLGCRQAASRIITMAGRLDPVADHDKLDIIAQALTHLAPLEVMEEALLHGSWKEGVVVARAMAGLRGGRSADVLKKAFWDKDRDLQREIISALRAVGGTGDAGFFLDVLERHEDGHILKESLCCLGQTMKYGQAAEPMFRFLEHPYDDVKEVALDCLVALGTGAITERFRRMLRSPVPVSRLMAVYALGKLGGPELLAELRESLEDEVPEIRKIALEAIAGKCGLTDDVLRVVVSRLHDESREVRLTLVRILGGCGGKEVEPYLLEALRDDHDWVRIRAIEALGERGAADAVEQLLPLIKDPNKLIALKVVEALGRISSPEAFQALMGVLGGEDPELAAGAGEILSRIRTGS
jgi:HEAT repeat protein